MQNLTILVLGVGGNVSMGIITALRNSNIPCKLIGACIDVESLGLYQCDVSYISPYANASNFIDWVAQICNKENVAMIFSGVEEIVYELEKNKHILAKVTDAIFISSTITQLNIGNNKLKTCEWLQENECNYPKFANSNNKIQIDTLINNCGFPLIAKPIYGKGSQGIIIINTIKDLDSVPKEDYCIQEYLGNENDEYTVGCYVNKDTILQDIIILKRKLKYGTTFYAEIIENDIIKDECVKICNLFNPIGPLNIQLRIHNNIPICFELNVRFSGTTPIRARFGFNDVEAMIKEYYFNQDISHVLKPAKQGKVYRFFNEFYIDNKMQDMLRDNKCITDTSIYTNFQETKK